MAYNKKQFLDLLIEYRSDEARRARRNVGVTTFAIILGCLLNLHLANMNLFGMNVSSASERTVLVIAFILLIYWSIMFLFTSFQDSKIQEERLRILKDEAPQLLERLKMIEKIKNDHEQQWYIYERDYPDYNEVKTSVEAYQLQQNRTKQASTAVKWMRRIEFCVPLVLTILAVLALSIMFKKTFS
jgi:hypothetical protein